MKLTKNNKRVLICPLNWGLGHAARCIVVIKGFQERGYEVIVASSGKAKAFIEQEDLGVQTIEFKDYDVKYYAKMPFWSSMLLQLPKISWGIVKEHFVLKKIVKIHKINLVLSDNRYGLFHPEVKSILMTHQLNLISSSAIINLCFKHIVGYFAKQFNEVWVPDLKDGERLAQKLSENTLKLKHVKYIGLLSRFNKVCLADILFDKLYLISGPDPERTVFMNEVIHKHRDSTQNIALLGGNPTQTKTTSINNIHFFNHLSTEELQELISKSKVVFCRAGYSSLMDVCKLEKLVIAKATKGQLEQEYLQKVHDLNHNQPKKIQVPYENYLSEIIDELELA